MFCNISEDIYKFAENGDSKSLLIALNQSKNCNNNLYYYNYHNQNSNNYEIDGANPLHIAIYNGNIKCVILLLGKIDIESKTIKHNHYSFTNLLECIYNNCISYIYDEKIELKLNNNLNCFTPLTIAIRSQNIECIKLLLKHGAKITYSSFFSAIVKGNVEIVRILLDKGDHININFKNEDNFTALDISAGLGHSNCTKLLLDNGVDIVIQNYFTDQCIQLINDEILNRKKRKKFDLFINLYINYFKDKIYSNCYPSGNLRTALPPIGWEKAEEIKEKYYFEEILFNLHCYLAVTLYKSSIKNNNVVIKTSNSINFFATSSNSTFQLMKIFSISIKEYNHM